MSTDTTHDYKKRIGAKIRLLRNSQNLSLRKLGLMVGMDYSHLFDIEHGKANATVESLAKIADGLGVELKDFFD